MAEIKTKPTDVSVDAFIEAVEHPVRRADGKVVRAMMESVTGEPAVMWGPSIVGFGAHHYRYETGREGDTFVVGFAPRAAAITFYGLFPSYRPEEEPLLEELGPHRLGKGCLYVTRLDRIDRGVLERLVAKAAKQAEAASAPSAP